MESLPSLADIEEEPPEVQRLRLYDLLKGYQDNYDIILVDESHNFRNPRTKCYRALMEIIRGGKPDKRVVLMTATPINNSAQPWPESTEGGGRVSVLKRQEGAPVLLCFCAPVLLCSCAPVLLG